MYKTLQYRYTPKKNERSLLKLLCHISKNLYNSALYELRQIYFQTNKTHSKSELTSLLKSNENFTLLNTCSSTNIIHNAYTTFNNFTKGYNKLPKYLKQNDYYLLYNEQIRPITINKEKYIKLPLSSLAKSSKTFNKMFEDELINKFIRESELKRSFYIYFKIPKPILDKTIKQLRIVPLFKGLTYNIEFVYIAEQPSFITYKSNNLMAIDLGINNLATCVTSNNEALIMDGRYLKSLNRFYNKRLALLKTKKPNQKKLTLMEYKVTDKRNRQIKDAIYKAAKQVITYSIKKEISEIIVGYNKNFKLTGVKKQNSKSTNQRFNQNFFYIPLSKFKDRLKILCHEQGIIYTETSEAYTSKCSFYDNEEIKFHKNYQGIRLNRGLFQTKDKKIVNADVNAALNIMRKCKPERQDIYQALRNRGQVLPIRQKIKLN
ncbi:MAG: transposase [Bacilli bacterium]|nr:transposase [Bacilli bacterium]